MNEWFPQEVQDFRSRLPPELGRPVGYAALIERYELPIPPPRLTRIAGRHHPVSTTAWQMLPPRHRPNDTLGAESGTQHGYRTVWLNAHHSPVKLDGLGFADGVHRAEVSC